MELDKNVEVVAKVGKTFKTKHHVATGPFSFMEIEVEAPMSELVKQAKWLADQFKDVQK